MSLIVQPAPLITKEPAAKVARRVRSGKWPGPAAMQMLGKVKKLTCESSRHAL